jgi:hypothetical protein
MTQDDRIPTDDARDLARYRRLLREAIESLDLEHRQACLLLGAALVVRHRRPTPTLVEAVEAEYRRTCALSTVLGVDSRGLVARLAGLGPL